MCASVGLSNNNDSSNNLFSYSPDSLRMLRMLSTRDWRTGEIYLFYGTKYSSVSGCRPSVNFFYLFDHSEILVVQLFGCFQLLLQQNIACIYSLFFTFYELLFIAFHKMSQN